MDVHSPVLCASDQGIDGHGALAGRQDQQGIDVELLEIGGVSLGEAGHRLDGADHRGAVAGPAAETVDQGRDFAAARAPVRSPGARSAGAA